MSRFLVVVGAVLIALGQLPRVVARDQLQWIVPIDSLFHSSTIGGAFVLAAVGHSATRALLRAREASRTGPLVGAVWFLVQLWVLQVVVLTAVAVSRALDSLGPATNLTAANWTAVLSFRWNYWVTEHLLGVPAELVGGMTLLSMVAQLVGLAAVVVALLPVRWNHVIIGVGAGLAATIVALLRVRAAGVQDPFVLLLDTFARSDAFFVGMLAACLGAAGVRVSASASGAAIVAMVGTVLATGFVSTEMHLALHLPVAAVLAGLAQLDDGSPGDELLVGQLTGSRGVASLATAWGPLIACVTPAAVIIGRRAEMHWLLRTTVLLIVVVVIVKVADAVVERVRLPEGPLPTLSGLLAGWRRVLAEADAEVRGHRGARPTSDPRDDAPGDGAS